MKTSLASVQDSLTCSCLLMKAHKNKFHVPSWPVCSCSRTLLEPLGRAVNKLLQPHAQTQPCCLKNSDHLKQKLEASGTLPPHSYLFTYDAQSMHANLHVDHATSCIKTCLSSLNDESIIINATVSGLNLRMHNNIFRFGDCVFLQINGTAMGTPAGPPLAQISFGTHEMAIVPTFLPNLSCHHHHIDDGFCIWTVASTSTDQEQWQHFQDQMNSFPGLTWDFSDQLKHVDFLDMTICIGDDNRVHTAPCEKPLNLHLHLPPHSSHPPGALLGLICCNVRRIYTLCSDPLDRIARTKDMLHHLLSRGCKSQQLLPIFHKAMHKAKGTCVPPLTTDDNSNPTFRTAESPLRLL